jgi:hypothetical protein
MTAHPKLKPSGWVFAQMVWTPVGLGQRRESVLDFTRFAFGGTPPSRARGVRGVRP